MSARSSLLLLLLPVAAGVAEFADIQAARSMSPFACMLVYRVMALLLLVPVAAAQASPRLDFTWCGASWSVLGAAVVAVGAPFWLRKAKEMDGGAIAGLTSCSPLVVAVLAYAWRGEVPKPLHAACVAGMIACAYGLTR